MLMKLKTIVAVLLVAFGIAAFSYQGVTYATQRRDTSPEPVPGSAEQEHTIPLPPILGAISLIAGMALLLVDRRDFDHAATP